MIRLIQRRLIIPRGDTGSFSLPVLANKNTGDVAVFTIFDGMTKTRMYQKIVEIEGDVLNIAFSHNDTVNLKPGKYFWDIKFYSNPQFVEDELVNGDEVDSYYAGFTLPACEIRETADNYLVSPDSPTATLSPEQLDIITGAISELNEAIRKTNENVEHYPEIRDEIWYVWDTELGDFVSTGVRANGIVGNGIASAVLNDDYTLTLNFTDGTSYTSPSIRGNGIEDIVLNNDYTLSIVYTDGDTYTTPSIRGPVGATPNLTIGTVQEGPNAAATITGTPANPVLNLTLPNADVPTRTSQLVNDSDFTTNEKVDNLVLVQDEQPTSEYNKIWVKETSTSVQIPTVDDLPTKVSELQNDANYAVDANYVHTDNNYTTTEKNKLSGIAAGAEVNVNADWNATSGDAQILNKPTNVSAFTNDAGYLTTETDPTVPAWAKAAQKPTYIAAEVGAPTVAEMNTAIGTAIGQINSFDIAVVQELPTQDINTHTIYLVPKTGETNDVYDEYVYINDNWEMVGNTQIDLSNYATKDELPDVPVQDVQIVGTSILSNGVANVPVASSTVAGVVKTNAATGISIQNGVLLINPAANGTIKNPWNHAESAYRPITATRQHYAVFYGLATAAGDTTQYQSDNAVGTYTDEAKAAIQQMLDVPSTGDIPDTSIYVTKESINNAGIFNREFIDISNGEQTVTTVDYGERGISKDITDVVGTFEGQCLRITFDGVEYLFNTNYVVIEDTWSEPLFYSAGDITKVPVISEYLIVDYNDSAPFCLLNSNSQRLLFTETAGTHTIKVEKQNRDVLKFSNELLYGNTASPAKYKLAGLQVQNSIGPNSIVNTLLKGTAIGVANHVEGDGGVAIGARNTVSGDYSTAVGGWKNEASGAYAFTSGLMNTASGNDSVALGIRNVASGLASFAMGRNNTASGKSSFALGENLIVNHFLQVAKGQFNKEDNSSAASTERGNYVEIVGNGTSANARSNAYALDWDGNGHYMGDVYVHANADSSGGVKLATINDIPEVPVTDVQVNGVSILSNGIANVPIAGSSVFGVVKARPSYGIQVITGGYLALAQASSEMIKNSSSSGNAIVPSNQHESIFYGLAKAAGADMASITNTTVGTYPDAQKEAIQSMLGISQMLAPTNPNLVASQAYAIGDVFAANGHLYKATAAIAQDGAIIPDTNCVETTMVDESVRDVQVAGSSVVGSDGVANIPVGNTNNFGVVKVGSGLFVASDNSLRISYAQESTVKSGTNLYSPITPFNQHRSTFYGLSKVAGVDLANETVTLGTYPETSKTAIRTMIGATSNNVIAVQDTQPTDPDTKIWLPETAPSPVQVPTVAEMNAALAGKVDDVQINGTSIVSEGVANIPIATNTTLGVVKCLGAFGVNVNGAGVAYVYGPSSAEVKEGTNTYKPIQPVHQHEAVFYGLAKVAGHDEKNSTEPVGTYTPEAKAAIQSMLGVSDLIATAENTLVASKAYAIGDVFTANGKLYKAISAIAANDTIVLQNSGETVSGANAVETNVGEDFVKFTDYATSSRYGVVKVKPGGGTNVDSVDKTIILNPANSAHIKQGTAAYMPITPSRQHESVFYGLAKAASDTTQSASSNAVGTYTDEAKAAIKSMIGVNVEDVQVNGTSIISGGVANVPVASTSGLGVSGVEASFGILVNNNGKLYTNTPNLNEIKSGSQAYKPIVPANVHTATFYGLAKASGDTTQSASSNAVGVYTDNAKASIKSMLGIVDGSTGTVDVSGTTPTITAVENTRYVCGEVTSLDFTPAASGICIIRFTSGSTVTVLTLPSTVKFPEWFDPTSLETNTIYEICITDGVYGAVMSWAL